MTEHTHQVVHAHGDSDAHEHAHEFGNMSRTKPETGASGDVGGDSVSRDEIVFSNIKRTYDEYQDLGLQAARQGQRHAEEGFRQAARHAETQHNQTVTSQEQLHNVALQALQNAVETANMVAKQSVRHGDLAIDRQWNVEVPEGAAAASILKALSQVIAQAAKPAD